VIGGLLLLVAFVVVAGGAYPRYNRVVYGAPLLVLALALLGAAGWRRRGRTTIWAAACIVMAAAVLVVWFRPSLVDARPFEPRTRRTHVLLTLEPDRLRAALAAELQPVDLPDCRLQRFGERNDGGYLLCANLLGSAAAVYNYGIGPADRFGCEVATRLSVPVHQYDCFDPGRPICSTGKTVFHDECIGPERLTDGGHPFDTLENQLARNGDGSNHVVVKIDIEGAEWDSLLATPPAVFERIDQLAGECHGVGLEKHLAAVRRLKEFFNLVHIHFTNFACGKGLDPFPAWAYEVLFVNKRLATAQGTQPWGPHALDARNDPDRPDCQAPTSRWSVLRTPGR
jgi:hypothetical protein